MSDITIPLWVLLAVAGLPTMILLMLSVRLMRIKRYRTKVAAQPKMESVPRQTAWEGFGRQMDHMILEQQIDSVFGALATILETERVKLKALICRNPGGISSAAYDEMLKSKREPLNDRYEDTQHEPVLSPAPGEAAYDGPDGGRGCCSRRDRRTPGAFPGRSGACRKDPQRPARAASGGGGLTAIYHHLPGNSCRTVDACFALNFLTY